MFYSVVCLNLLLLAFLLEVTSAKLHTNGAFDFDDDDDNEIDSQWPARGRQREERINLSYPGTRWCGPGNTAADYDDLGSSAEVDKCCRDHDHCDAIAAGETKYGLNNDDYFTRLHCRCDKEFKECLKKANNNASKQIGNLYFTVRDRCYKEQYPIEGCEEEKHKIFLRRCTKYVVDRSRPRKMQWFDLPFYDDEENYEFNDVY